MVEIKRETKNIPIRIDLLQWLEKEHPRRIGEFLEPLIEKEKAKRNLEDNFQRANYGIPPGLKRENGFVEYAPKKSCEEKDFWRIESILKEIHESKKWPNRTYKNEERD